MADITSTPSGAGTTATSANGAGQPYVAPMTPPPVTPTPATPPQTPAPTGSSNPADANYNPALNYNIPKVTPLSVTAPLVLLRMAFPMVHRIQMIRIPMLRSTA